MLKKTKEILLKNSFLIFWAFALAFTGAAVSLPPIVHFSESSFFCGLCHSMKDQYKTWSVSRHRTLKCVDCHLPNSNKAEHFFWKAIDGNKDLISETLGLKEDYEIRLSDHGKKVLQENCIRCHADIVSRMNTKRNCVDCHRGVSHIKTAAVCSYNTEVK